MRQADETSVAEPAGYEVKASALRVYMVEIEKLGLLSEVMAKVRPETRRTMEAPPLPSSWIDAGPIEDMVGVVESLRGLDAVRAMTKGGQAASGLTLLRPILTGLLRLFGATPNTLFSRWSEVTKTALRGVKFEWVLETPTSGRLTINFPRKNVPRHAYVGMESGCQLMLEVSGVKGSVSETEIGKDGSTGTIRVRW